MVSEVSIHCRLVPLLWDLCIMVESFQRIKDVQPLAAGKQRDLGRELRQDTPAPTPMDIRGDRLPSLESVPKSFNSFPTMPSDRGLSVGLCTDKNQSPQDSNSLSMIESAGDQVSNTRGFGSGHSLPDCNTSRVYPGVTFPY